MIKTKFRGYCTWAKKWVFGQYVLSREVPAIETETSIVPIQVQKDSIGMYWRDDYLGREIYEGDEITFKNFLFGPGEVWEIAITARVGRNQDGFTLKVLTSDFLDNFDLTDNIPIPVSSFSCLSEDSIELVEV